MSQQLTLQPAAGSSGPAWAYGPPRELHQQWPGPLSQAQAACSLGRSQLDITEELLHGSRLYALGHVWSPKPIVKELGHVLGKQNPQQNSLVTIWVPGQSKCRGSLSLKNILFTTDRVQPKAGGGVTLAEGRVLSVSPSGPKCACLS